MHQYESFACPRHASPQDGLSEAKPIMGRAARTGHDGHSILSTAQEGSNRRETHRPAVRVGRPVMGFASLNPSYGSHPAAPYL
jgi:hypothetical protein